MLQSSPRAAGPLKVRVIARRCHVKQVWRSPFGVKVDDEKSKVLESSMLVLKDVHLILALQLHF